MSATLSTRDLLFVLIPLLSLTSAALADSYICDVIVWTDAGAESIGRLHADPESKSFSKLELGSSERFIQCGGTGLWENHPEIPPAAGCMMSLRGEKASWKLGPRQRPILMASSPNEVPHPVVMASYAAKGAKYFMLQAEYPGDAGTLMVGCELK